MDGEERHPALEALDHHAREHRRDRIVLLVFVIVAVAAIALARLAGA